MSKLVILNLGKGNLLSGFPFVTVQIKEDNYLQWRQFQGSLPASSIILDLYRRWQLLYELIYESRYINCGWRQQQDKDENITIHDADITNFSDRDFDQVCQHLKHQIDIWLDAEGFRKIERQLRRQLHIDDDIRFIIQTEDIFIKKIPWHLWHFCDDYPKMEIGISSLEFEPKPDKNHLRRQIRILAILGSNQDINIDTDKNILGGLINTEIVFTVEPQHSDLDALIADKQGWDIIFFAGHSYSNFQKSTGYLYINKNECLNINQIHNSLKTALNYGLKIAIFNSCDGLGLVQQLESLHIPQIIVMREKVPDQVAQTFLKYFLDNFAEGQSFYLAVRQARERLQGLESEFPCASWLPIICQNPTELSPTWSSLQGKENNLRSRPKLNLNFYTALGVSLILTTVVAAIRSYGVLQTWELQAFDHLMQKRSPELEDSRILVIGADEKDLQTYGYPLPDLIITKVLTKIQQYKPAAIGLNIVRDVPVPNQDKTNHQVLIKYLQNNRNITTVCAFNKSLEQTIAPPRQLLENQLGFVDLYNDSSLNNQQDKTVRRYLLSRSENPIVEPSTCKTNYSLAWQLAYQYFNLKKIPVTTISNDWKFGTVIVKRLAKNSGGYQNLDARGNQVLINYRHTPNPQQIAQQVTIRDILDTEAKNGDRFDPDWVKNRVVLIGVVASSVKDPQQTPYGEMRSLYLHAHVVSQLLSAVEDKRPLIWWLPIWAETLWVWGWTFIGSLMLWQVKTTLYRVLALAIASVILYGICWSILTVGGWLPLIPTIIALVAPWGFVWLVSWVNSKQKI